MNTRWNTAASSSSWLLVGDWRLCCVCILYTNVCACLPCCNPDHPAVFYTDGSSTYLDDQASGFTYTCGGGTFLLSGPQPSCGKRGYCSAIHWLIFEWAVLCRIINGGSFLAISWFMVIGDRSTQQRNFITTIWHLLCVYIHSVAELPRGPVYDIICPLRKYLYFLLDGVLTQLWSLSFLVII